MAANCVLSSLKHLTSPDVSKSVAVRSKNAHLYRRAKGNIRKLIVAGVLAVISTSVPSQAASPEMMLRGQQLFTQDFVATPLTDNGDGLGPLFNNTSCVACHHAGGVGGGGDHRFNARTFAISKVDFDQTKSAVPFLETFEAAVPGFVNVDRSIVNTFPLHRRGGSSAFDSIRRDSMEAFNPNWADDSKINSDAIHGEASPHQIIDSTGSLTIIGHVNARNTTALFGAGLIDQVPESTIVQQFKDQQRHPEIHGRPATLADGRIGRFGWRANFATLVDFTENACVNELGLQSKRVAQPKDITQRQYVNTRMDIDDDSIVAMNSFISALPSPTRMPARDELHRKEISTGEQRFGAIGCAVCHVPTLGPAKGVYSDLLLHDMGPASTDYNPAPPYRKNNEIEYEQFGSMQRASYYGVTSPLTVTVFRSNPTRSREFRFEAPQRPPRTVREPVNIGRDDVVFDLEPVRVYTSRGSLIESRGAFQRMSIADTIPTNFSQEWRTAPLWGLRDSAPYMHDGRAETVLEAIAMHDGESQKTRNRFFALPYPDQQAVLAFLDTFAAPQSGVIPMPKDFTRRHLAKN